MAAVQIAPVAERAGIATGTVYRYFPSKTDLVTALVGAIAEREIGAIGKAGKAAPGPLSALAAAIATFAARALRQRKLAWALIAEPVDAEAEAVRLAYPARARRGISDPHRRRDAGRPSAGAGCAPRGGGAGRCVAGGSDRSAGARQPRRSRADARRGAER